MQLKTFVISLTLGFLLHSVQGAPKSDENPPKLIPMVRLNVASIDSNGNLDTFKVFPEEMIEEVFGTALDSLVNDFYIRNAFNIDSFSFGDSSIINLMFGDFEDQSQFAKMPPLDDSSYIQRLQGIDAHFELTYNSLVRDIIVMYTGRKRKQVSVMLGLANYYFPMIEEVFDKHELPHELKYLAIIESALNPRAFSRAGACGIWQFMLGTGRMYNLEITTFVDERRDPLKSTEAAARYLKDLFNIYGDWQMVIAAYNCGPGNVNKAIKRTGGKTNYWDIFYSLPRETRSYVPAFIAATYVMNYYKLHGIIPLQPNFPIVTDTILVNQYLHLEQVAGQLNISIEMLRELNPMYRRDVIPGRPEKPYPLCLPLENVLAFIENENQVFAYEREKYFSGNQVRNPSNSRTASTPFVPAEVKGKDRILYTVKSGDNVGFIADWFKIRIADLRYWNNLKGNLIREGQQLEIYVEKGKADYYNRFNQMSFQEKQAAIGKSDQPQNQILARADEPKDGDYIYHTVRQGDNLWDIAKKYPGVSADDIRRLNNISNTRGLTIGQSLKIKKVN